jgi:hypothetical protein
MRLTSAGTAEHIRETGPEMPVDIRAKKTTARRGQILLLHSRITTLYEQEAHRKGENRTRTAIYCIFVRKSTKRAGKKKEQHRKKDRNPLRGCRITVRKSRQAKLFFKRTDRD